MGTNSSPPGSNINLRSYTNTVPQHHCLPPPPPVPQTQQQYFERVKRNNFPHPDKNSNKTIPIVQCLPISISNFTSQQNKFQFPHVPLSTVDAMLLNRQYQNPISLSIQDRDAAVPATLVQPLANDVPVETVESYHHKSSPRNSLSKRPSLESGLGSISNCADTMDSILSPVPSFPFYHERDFRHDPYKDYQNDILSPNNGGYSSFPSMLNQRPSYDMDLSSSVLPLSFSPYPRNDRERLHYNDSFDTGIYGPLKSPGISCFNKAFSNHMNLLGSPPPPPHGLSLFFSCLFDIIVWIGFMDHEKNIRQKCWDSPLMETKIATEQNSSVMNLDDDSGNEFGLERKGNGIKECTTHHNHTY